MQAIISSALAALSRLFGSRAGPWITQVLLFLGLGFATKQAVVDPILGYLADGFSGLPSAAAQWIAFVNIDVYCSAVASAYIAAAGKRVIMRKLSA